MVAPVWVLDATCLSHFARAERLDVLRDLLVDKECWTTRVVLEELDKGVAEHPALQGVRAGDWLKVAELDTLDEVQLFASWVGRTGSGERDLGEASVFAAAELHRHLVIHFLTADDLPLAELFGTQTGDAVDKFAGLPVDSGPGGAPVLRQCPNWLAVRRIALLDEGGDHVCLTTEPVAAQTALPFRPLRISQAGHLKAGHGAGERPEPPTERAAPA